MDYCKKQAAWLSSEEGGMDTETARLYTMAGDAAEAMLRAQSQPQLPATAANVPQSRAGEGVI